MTEYTLGDVLIKVEGVSLSFGETKVLKAIDMEVRDILRPGCTQGQIIGVLGPSGIGKTQFSRMLTGLQKPTTGQITMSKGGKLVPVEPGAIGLVEQAYPLFRHRTVMGNLLIATEHSGLSKAKRREKAHQMLAEFKLADKAKSYPSQLSGGQRQRVAIIRQLLSSERYLVMDEPFTGLDPIMKDRTCDLIRHVGSLDDANTIFVVAHDISALVKISDCLWLFGREQNPDGSFVPGAFIKKHYNLIELGLAWREGIETTREFMDFCVEVKSQFKHL